MKRFFGDGMIFERETRTYACYIRQINDLRKYCVFNFHIFLINISVTYT